jgi:hypothetical protein
MFHVHPYVSNADTICAPPVTERIEMPITPDVLTSPAFAQAVDQGRWPKEVRPFTGNRHHTLYKVMK